MINHAPKVVQPITFKLIKINTQQVIEMRDLFLEEDLDPITYEIKMIEGGSEYDLPEWISHGVITKQLTITPLVSHIGYYQVQIKAIDPFQAVGIILFQMEVYHMEPKPAEVFVIGTALRTTF